MAEHQPVLLFQIYGLWGRVGVTSKLTMSKIEYSVNERIVTRKFSRAYDYAISFLRFL